MELKDFTEKEQEQIEKGLSEAVLNDREAGEKNLKLALFAVAKREGALPEKEREELREIITAIFEEKMQKHKIR